MQQYLPGFDPQRIHDERHQVAATTDRHPNGWTRIATSSHKINAVGDVWKVLR
jgi:hypothetical protein